MKVSRERLNEIVEETGYDEDMIITVLSYVSIDIEEKSEEE